MSELNFCYVKRQRLGLALNCFLMVPYVRIYLYAISLLWVRSPGALEEPVLACRPLPPPHVLLSRGPGLVPGH